MDDKRYEKIALIAAVFLDAGKQAVKTALDRGEPIPPHPEGTAVEFATALYMACRDLSSKALGELENG